jgi:hypothetical protein
MQGFDLRIGQKLPGILSACLIIGSNAEDFVTFFKGICSADYFFIKFLVELSLYPLDVFKDILAGFHILDGNGTAVRAREKNSQKNDTYNKQNSFHTRSPFLSK